MRHVTLCAILILLATLAGGGRLAGAAAAPASPPAAAVDSQVWADLRTAPDHRTAFVVVMREAAVGGPASAIDAQLGLREPLALLRSTGSAGRVTPHYGANILVVEGGPVAVRFLAEWPGVAAIHAYRPGQTWEASTLVAASPAATGRIAGVVTGSNGTTPLTGIQVTAYVQVTVESWNIVGQVNTGSGGAYGFTGLATGIYRVEYTDPAGTYAHEFYNDQSTFNQATNVSVTDGQTTTLNASLAQAGKISGTVGGADGGGNILVSTWRYVSGAWRSTGSALSANNGAYTVGGLLPGTYRVQFSDGLSPARYVTEYYNNVTTLGEASDLIVTAGQTTSSINATLGSYGKLTGKVTAPDGTTGLDGVTVDLYEYDTAGGTWNWASYGDTDAAGLYEVNGLVTRDYRVEFSDPLGQFTGKFYNNKATVETADSVHVNLGAITANINASLALQTVTLDHSLAIGWNLISLPLTLGSTQPATVFSSLGANYSLVYAYDGCLSTNQWKSYAPNIPPDLNTLSAVDVKPGLWLQTTAPATLSLTGIWPIATSINLCTGWNLIGYPSVTAKPPATALSSIAGKYSLVYGYNAADTVDPWKKYDPAFPVGNDLASMQPGWGYWIRMTQNATLTIPGR